MSVPVVTIYRNGDLHFFGKKLVVNQKRLCTFDNFLDKVTQDTQARVAIRRICTPNHGTRIQKLEQLENGGVYVAVGSERFKRLQYSKIRSVHPTLQPERPPIKNVKPVLHSRIHVSARYRKVAHEEPLKNRIIYVFRNGEPTFNGLKLLLDKRMLQNMDTVLQYITDKIKLRTGAVRSLFTLDGDEVKETKDIETGTRYVAVGFDKPFIKALYNKDAAFSVTPRRIAQSKISSVDSSPKYKSGRRTRSNRLKKLSPDKEHTSPQEKKVKNQSNKAKNETLDKKENAVEMTNVNTYESTGFQGNFLSQLTAEIDEKVNDFVNEDSKHIDYAETERPNEVINNNEMSQQFVNEQNVMESTDTTSLTKESTFDSKNISYATKQKEEAQSDINTVPVLSREGTYDTVVSTSTEIKKDTTIIGADTAMNTNHSEETLISDRSIKKNKKKKLSTKKSKAFGGTYAKNEEENAITEAATIKEHWTSTKKERKGSKVKKGSVVTNQYGNVTEEEKDGLSDNMKAEISETSSPRGTPDGRPHPKSSDSQRISNTVPETELADPPHPISPISEAENNGNLEAELSGTPPKSPINDSLNDIADESADIDNEADNDSDIDNEAHKYAEVNETVDHTEGDANNLDPTNDDTNPGNNTDEGNNDEGEYENKETLDSESSTVYKASGETSESADQIKDDQDTKVEKTIDMQVAEEVLDEEIEDEAEDTNDVNESDTTKEK